MKTFYCNELKKHLYSFISKHRGVRRHKGTGFKSMSSEVRLLEAKTQEPVLTNRLIFLGFTSFFCKMMMAMTNDDSMGCYRFHRIAVRIK